MVRIEIWPYIFILRYLTFGRNQFPLFRMNHVIISILNINVKLIRFVFCCVTHDVVLLGKPKVDAKLHSDTVSCCEISFEMVKDCELKSSDQLNEFVFEIKLASFISF